MPCQDIKETMISALYQEEDLSAEAQRQLEAHLATCAACRQEIGALTATRHVMTQWAVEAPPSPIVDLAAIPTAGWGIRLKQFFDTWLLPAGRLGYRTAVAGMALLGFLAVFNTEVTWDGGKLAFRPHLSNPLRPPAPTSPKPPDSVVEAKERKLNDEEMMQWVEGRIMESQRSTALQMQELADYWRRAQGSETNRKVAALEHKFGQLSKQVSSPADAKDRKLNLDKN